MILSNWLVDPAAWGTIVAAIAVVLSQLPPLKVYIQPPHLKLSLPDRFTVTHYLGNPQLVVLVTVENTCARKVTVTRLEGLLLLPSGAATALPGQQYISRQPSVVAGQAQPELLLVGISLKPDESWSETVRFVESFSEDEEDRANRIATSIKKDLTFKHMTQRSDIRYETDARLVAEAAEFFKEKFRLVKGNYTFIIAARDERGQILDVQGAEFTLFENSVATLREVTDEYKYGAGIYFPSQLSGMVLPRSRPIPADRARELFQKRYPA